jgi:hypothetical protein
MALSRVGRHVQATANLVHVRHMHARRVRAMRPNISRASVLPLNFDK